MDNVDIRWKQRFLNFEKVYKRLSYVISAVEGEPDNEVLTAGLIQTYKALYCLYC